MKNHLIVISTENHAYHGWQAMVATYSCMKRQGVSPLIVVHGALGEDLHPFFERCREAGAWIFRSRNYVGSGDHHWAARNTAASLMDAAVLGRKIGTDFLVLMDPDLVWTRKIQWPTRLAVDKICLEEVNRARARPVADLFGLELNKSSPCRWGARVPYVVPIGMADNLGDLWWQAMEVYSGKPDRIWSDQMTSWSLAMAKHGARPARMTFSQTNWDYKARVSAPLLHYAYECPYWYKQSYTTEEEIKEVWDPPELPIHSVQGWVSREISMAGEFYKAIKKCV